MTMLAVGAGGGALGGLLGGLGASSANSAASKQAALVNAPYNSVIGQGESLMGQAYQPYTGQLVAPETASEEQASTVAGGLQAQEAPDLAAAGQQWNTATMNKYMNPYIQAAINVPEQQLALQYGGQMAALQRNQSMTDAFGVGRSAAQQGVLNRNYETEFGNIQATGMANAYNAAEGAFQADTSRYAKLASETGALGTQDISNLLTTGQNERSIAQAQDTANYQQFENAQNWGLKRYQAVAGDITNAASHEVVPQKSSVLTGILGGAMSGVGSALTLGSSLGLGGGGQQIDTSGATSAASDSSNFGSWSGVNSAANDQVNSDLSGVLGLTPSNDDSTGYDGGGAKY